MKFKIKLRKTIVKETFIEVDLDGNCIAAMNLAEGVMEAHPEMVEPQMSVTEGKWTAVAVTTEE